MRSRGSCSFNRWSFDAPSQVQGSEEERLAAFRKARDELRQRIEPEVLETTT
jgi:hypothetical protein